MKAKPANVDDYRWNYGQLGQALVEDEIRAGSGEWAKKGIRLKRGWRLIDGHAPEISFTNFHGIIKHRDLIMATAKNVIQAMIEVKTTTDQSKREFEVHGASAAVLYAATKADIPIYLSVVRLTNKPPVSIVTAFNDYLEFLRTHPTRAVLAKHRAHG